ncbi:MAG TPA: tetratricopeptide repeat protein [Isosphaeraceae bacterium]|jgi:TolA-binding protein|nr:tetratricopeptide repeat protein [Isosphaeraceae bacterium]
MTRRVLAMALVGLAPWAAARGAEDGPSRPLATAEKFLAGLRERGYHDLALDYIEELRKAPDTPADLKQILDFEEGRVLSEDAARATDPERRAAELGRARAKLEAFVRDHANHPRSAEALEQLAHLFVERGQLAAIEDKAADARAEFGKARTYFDQAVDRLKKAYEPLKGRNFDEADPRREQQSRAHSALMTAEIGRALVDYEESLTFPEKSPDRNALLDKAAAAFKDLFDRYRTWQGGLFARMYQGKCLEEKGELGAAMGVYNELMQHNAAQLRPIQRQVDYFRIIVYGKRQEFALAADEAGRWIAANPNEARTDLGLGVRMELVKNLLAQLPKAEDPAERNAAVKKATDLLTEVARVPSRHRREALALLQKYKPRAATNLTAINNLNYEQAMAEGDDAAAAQDWPRAVALYRQAVRRADPARDAEKANKARFQWASAALGAKDYYEADVLAEHIARRYPKSDLAQRAAETGINALIEAYNAYRQVDWASDLDRIVALASYAAATWPDAEVADNARFVIGNVELMRGRFEDAAKALEAIRATSPRHLDGESRAGLARWSASLALRDKPEAKAEADKALAHLQAALKARQELKAPPTDPALVEDACNLAAVLMAQGKPKDALAVLDPLAQGAGAKPAPKLLESMLKAHVAAGQIDRAVGDMKALQAAGGSGQGMTQLYYGLGRALEDHMAELRAKGDRFALEKTQKDYLAFLEALAASQAGQSFDSLLWAGEAMLSVGAPEKAEALLNRLITTYATKPEFQKGPGADKLARAKVKLATAQREQRAFDKAEKTLGPLLKTDPRALIELGLVLEDRAEFTRSGWERDIAHWKRLATLLGRARHKRPEYFDAWYHVAYGLDRMGQPTEARKVLHSVMALSPTVGTPEIKKKYEDLLKKLDGGPAAARAR